TEFTIIHGYAGDKYGNVQWPLVRDTDDMDQPMATAAKRLIVTVEKIVPHEEIKKEPARTYIPGHWVEAIVEVPYGAHPEACDTIYDEDDAAMKDCLAACRTAAGAQGWLDHRVHAPADHAAYLALFGGAEALSRLKLAEAAA